MHLITTSEALRTLVTRAVATGLAAVDTEFVSHNSYYPKLALIQVALDSEDVAVIDPLVIRDLTPLGMLLGHDDVVKVLHAPETDLALLHDTTGTVPCNIFDTQCAASLVGLPKQVSLAGLVAALLNEVLNKSETVTAWLRRPLRPKQLAYACDDVRYLCQAYKVLQGRLARLGREAWLAEEMQGYSDRALYTPADVRTAYLRFRRLNRLTGKQRAAIQAVAAWREAKARQLDTPRRWLLPDGAVKAIAIRLPRNLRHLGRIRDLPDGFVGRYGQELLLEVQSVRALSPEDYPPEPPSLPSDDAFTARAASAAAFVRERAENRHVAPQRVASLKEVKAHVAGFHSPLRSGWRYEFVGRDLDRLLKSGDDLVTSTDPPRPQHSPAVFPGQH